MTLAACTSCFSPPEKCTKHLVCLQQPNVKDTIGSRLNNHCYSAPISTFLCCARLSLLAPPVRLLLFLLYTLIYFLLFTLILRFFHPLFFDKLFPIPSPLVRSPPARPKAAAQRLQVKSQWSRRAADISISRGLGG